MSDAAVSIPRLESVLERPTDRGWRYQVQIAGPKGVSEHAITLSWVDHDYWTGGKDAPSTTLERVVTVALAAGMTLPPKVDCSTIRRLMPSIDHSFGPNIRIGRSAA